MKNDEREPCAEKTLTIPLRDFMGSAEGWGREQGAHLAAAIRSSIEAEKARIIRLSMCGVERMDVTCTGELIRLFIEERKKRGFCLLDLRNTDLIENWDATATWRGQPIFVWNPEWNSETKHWLLLGPDPGVGLGPMLEHVFSVERSSTSDAAAALHLKIPNASNKLKALWEAGYILRQERCAISGGVEYEYVRIA